MNKTIIVSNRLPIDLSFNGNTLNVKSSVGGLATGMKSVHAEGNGLWIGWAGLTDEEIPKDEEAEVDRMLLAQKCVRVSLSSEELEKYYYGFSNKALWPLFHYFQAYTEFDLQEWESYVAVNHKFADIVLEHAVDGDTIWIHDYQLLLLPAILRASSKDLTIGFFLHIPFPSYELFRTCPWRDELLHGMLGSDLLGFHTYDYVRHFISTASRLGGLDVQLNEISYRERTVRADFFPMGIDYSRYHEAALEHKNRPEGSASELMRNLDNHINAFADSRLILSIDRMDYTKGIPNRIRAFEYFLDKYPQYRGKVRLVMLAVPSRENVAQYQKLKRETDELVGRINGRFATVNWTPIWYFYRSMPFDDLIDLYAAADVALITPIRDGMNLVAKEYIASRTDNKGVLVISEMAGAAKELHEALVVNPNNFEQIADILKQALEMSQAEQGKRMKTLQQRVKRYDVERWSQSYLQVLRNSRTFIPRSQATPLEANNITEMKRDFERADKKLLLLDYDGTLVGFKNLPIEAAPDAALFALLDGLARQPGLDVVIISGRDRATLEEWFGDKPYTLVTDHGVWLRAKRQGWSMTERLKSDWKHSVQTVLEAFTDSTPGTFIEEKDYSLAWHYRRADSELALMRTAELKHVLTELLSNNALAVLEGNKVLEIKSSNINKGRVTAKLITECHYDFILAVGDDWTDEYMFEELPDTAYTVKVGTQKTAAKYYVSDVSSVRSLLQNL